jgi:predicted RNase H-like HicB family nuclease
MVLPLDHENGGGFIAYALDLPGCMADGETPVEALEELRRALSEWIFEAVRLGRNIPPPSPL